MGSRANYVVVDDNGWRLYYSHWGAQQVDVHLSAGWLPALQYVQVQQRCEPVPDDPTHGWLDDRWGEGGALIDLRHRHLLFFGAVEFMPVLHYRRAYFALLAQTWPGWTVEWAYRGLSQLAEYVDVAPAVADDPERLGRSPDRPSPLPAEESQLAVEGWWTLVTVREADGRMRAYAAADHPHPVAFGDRMHTMIRTGADTQTTVKAAVAPSGGAHIDVAAHRLTWWSTEDQPTLFKDLPGLWPGWDVHFHGDDYEGHLNASGLQLPPVDLARGFAEVEHRLVREYADPVQQATDLVELLRADGADVRVTAPIAAHTEIERPLEVRAAVTAGLAAARHAAGLS